MYRLRDSLSWAGVFAMAVRGKVVSSGVGIGTRPPPAAVRGHARTGDASKHVRDAPFIAGRALRLAVLSSSPR